MPEIKNLKSLTFNEKKIHSDAIAEALKTIPVKDFETAIKTLRNISIGSLNDIWGILHILDTTAIEADRDDVLMRAQNILFMNQKN